MPRYKFTSHDLTVFKRLLDRLGLTQKDFAKRAKLTEAWVSQVLAGIRKGAELKTLHRIVKTFQRSAEERHRSGIITQADLDEVLSEIETFRSPAGAASPAQFISDPGGPVPLGARNYVDPFPKVWGIEKPLRDQIARFLHMKLFSASVFGPPQSGVTSLLLRFMDQAEKAGTSTAFFDCKKVVDHIEPVGTDADLGKFTSYLGNSLAQSWGKTAPEITSSSDFLDWVQDALGDSLIRLLIIDNLSALGNLAMPFLDLVVRPIKTLRASSKVLVDFVFGIHPEDMKNYSAFELSPVLGTHIELAWMSENQTHKLVELFDEKNLGAEFFKQYGGQPFLTHIAIAYFHQSKSHRAGAVGSLTPTKIYKMAELAEGAFAQHFNLIKDLLLQKGHQGATDNACLESLDNFCKKKATYDLDFPDLEVAEFLAKASVVKKAGSDRYEPTLPLYCSYAKRLRKQSLKAPSGQVE